MGTRAGGVSVIAVAGVSSATACRKYVSLFSCELADEPLHYLPPRTRAPAPPRGPDRGVSSVDRPWFLSLPAPRSRKAVVRMSVQ
jgi:hypothetical protein